MKDRVLRKLLFLGLVAMFFLTLVGAASAQPGEFVKGVLQPLADGFPKEAIKLVVVDDPGSKDDLYAKSLQAAARDMSPVSIMVNCEPSAEGGTWFTIKDVTRRHGGTDGYYPVTAGGCFGFVTDLLVDPQAEAIGAKLEWLNMIIATDIWPYTTIQRKNAPWGPTWAGLVKYGKENPGKLKLIARIGGGQHICTELFLKKVGVEVKVIPGGTFQDCASAVGAGAADFHMCPMDTAQANERTGRVDVILLTGSVKPEIWSKNPNIVTAKEAGLPTEVGGSLFGLGAPSEVPQAHVDWLYKLFNAAALSDIHKKRAQTLPGTVWALENGKFWDSKRANFENAEIIRISEPLIRDLGMHLDQQKK